VVEVVVSLAESDESSDDVVTRRVAVVKGLVAEPVGKGIDTESSLLNEESATEAGIDKAAKVITPAKTGNQGRKDEGKCEDPADVVCVLVHYFPASTLVVGSVACGTL